MSANGSHRPEPIIVAGTEMFELLEKALTKLKYPKLRYSAENGNSGTNIVFYVASARARHPGSIQVTDGKGYAQGFYYGNVVKSPDCNDSVFNPNAMGCSMVAGIEHKIVEILSKPTEMAKMQGQRYGTCCFCGRELTHPNSVTVGYGPICAENYGLPWDGTAEQARLAEIDDDIKDVFHAAQQEPKWAK